MRVKTPQTEFIYYIFRHIGQCPEDNKIVESVSRVSCLHTDTSRNRLHKYSRFNNNFHLYGRTHLLYNFHLYGRTHHFLRKHNIPIQSGKNPLPSPVLYAIIPEKSRLFSNMADKTSIHNLTARILLYQSKGLGIGGTFFNGQDCSYPHFYPHYCFPLFFPYQKNGQLQYATTQKSLLFRRIFLI